MTNADSGGGTGGVGGATLGGGGTTAVAAASGAAGLVRAGGSANGGSETSSRGGSAGSTVNAGGSATSDAGRGGRAGSAVARAGGANGGAGAAPSGCAGRNWLLCEDFESTELGAVPSGWTQHGELATVDDTDAHGGSRSLRLGPAPNAERRIYHDAKLLGSAHWARIYYKVQTPVPDAFVHSTLVSLIGDGPKNGRSDYRPIDTVKQAKDTKDVGGRHNFIYNVQIVGKSEFGTETHYDYTFDAKWHCAEYHIDAADQSYTLYFDGKDVLHFTHGAGNYDDSDIPNQFDELRVGWINYQSAAPGFTAFIDDIAFDEKRIGCD
ncbi:MAG TPA: hypothetical protein VER96_22360 [Polyangiaceae bacterium]|nr:hypothetical protein [Polyangiaceae bacterium]